MIEDIGALETDRKALIKLTKAIELYPHFAAAFIYRGLVNEMLGFLINYGKILGDYNLAIMYDPKFGKAYELRRTSVRFEFA